MGLRAGEGAVLARRYLVRGRVQGVGYRDFALRRATELGVRGFVRNEADGSVSAYAMGSSRQLADFEAWLRRGPSMADVRGIESSDGVIEPCQNFSIRR